MLISDKEAKEGGRAMLCAHQQEKQREMARIPKEHFSNCLAANYFIQPFPLKPAHFGASPFVLNPSQMVLVEILNHNGSDLVVCNPV